MPILCLDPKQENELNWSRRGVLGFMLGGTVAYGLFVRTVAGPPLAAVDRRNNVALLKTAGGNVVAATTVGARPAMPCSQAVLSPSGGPRARLACGQPAAAGAAASRARRSAAPLRVALHLRRGSASPCLLPVARPATAARQYPRLAQDAAGRVFMFDRAGNIYYDTEDPRTGLYIVRALARCGGAGGRGARQPGQARRQEEALSACGARLAPAPGPPHALLRPPPLLAATWVCRCLRTHVYVWHIVTYAIW